MNQPDHVQSQNPVQADQPQPEPTASRTKERFPSWLIVFASVNIALLALNIGVGLSWKQEAARQVEKGMELANKERKLETAEKDLEEAQKIIDQLAAQTKQHAEEAQANRIKTENSLRETESSLARIRAIKKSMHY